MYDMMRPRGHLSASESADLVVLKGQIVSSLAALKLGVRAADTPLMEASTMEREAGAPVSTGRSA